MWFAARAFAQGWSANFGDFLSPWMDFPFYLFLLMVEEGVPQLLGRIFRNFFGGGMQKKEGNWHAPIFELDVQELKMFLQSCKAECFYRLVKQLKTQTATP